MKLKKFLTSTDFFEYGDEQAGSEYRGNVLGKGSMDLKFDVVERSLDK